MRSGFGRVALRATFQIFGNRVGLVHRIRVESPTTPSCALLGICDRTVEVSFPNFSLHQRLKRAVADEPKTLGEHLRRVRIDRKMTNVQVAHSLRVAYQTVEKWEHNRKIIGPKSRPKVVAFIGYDPDAPAGDFNT